MSRFTVKEAFDRIELCYERMQMVDSTSGRKYNYEEILIVMKECPAMADYWRLREASRYVDRIVKVKNYREPKSCSDTLASWVGESFDKRDFEACAYVVWLEDYAMIKVGKTKNLNTRISQLKGDYGKVKLLHTFGFSNEEDAYIMEVVLHKYYKKYYKECAFIPQDRFLGADLNSTDIKILESAAEKIRLEKWF